ncbi:hypothetical protein DRJ17_00310 [Candidatus Woesearchaeota archaeon]|nr:MAG: hypothetical protein DRJ17_00310 [Candidatus Woesearchaeota archaeon]
MSNWEFTLVGKKPKLKNPILIEGLPGIGNVGKIVVDFLIEQLKPKKIYDIFSPSFPHSVFVNEKNLVELPSIEMYYLDINKRSFLLLTGDVQPTDEVNSYEFVEKVLDVVSELGCKEIITIGGIGLQQPPKKPRIFCTGNNAAFIRKYKGSADNRLYGVVGPIIGASGLLLGLGQKRKINAMALLAETFVHPMYLGVDGAQEVLKILDNNFRFKIDLKKLTKELKEVKTELKKISDLGEVSKQTAMKKAEKVRQISYIG